MMDWESIRAEFELSDISLKDLAEKHGIKPATLRSRKNREKWQKRGSPDDATQRKNVATQKKVVPKAKEILESGNLEDWEEVFCLEYLKHFNKTKAYQKARPEVSYNTASSEGSKTYGKPKIQKRLGELKQARNEQLFIQAADIDEQWARQAFADVSDFVEFGTETQAVLDDDGNLQEVIKNYVRFRNADEVDGSLIQEVKMGRDGPVIKLYDKQKAMQELQKRLGDGNGGKQIIINNPWGVPYGPKPD